jgi:cation diffusion facilitator family transporter
VHGHRHGLIDLSIIRSRDGLKTVGLSLGVLLATSVLQGVIFIATGSVALLADLIHNFGDELTAIPVGIAFVMRSFVAEKRAGYFVVAAIFVSACVAAVAAVDRLINPQTLDHLDILAAAGAIGFIGNEIAAQIRLRAGKRLGSPALIADGNHARTDGLVSLAVVASAIVVALGFNLGDPIIGLVITLVILRITWQSFQVTCDGLARRPRKQQWAVRSGIRRPVRVPVMDPLVAVGAEQLVRTVIPQRRDRGRVGKPDPVVAIDDPNRLCRLQNGGEEILGIDPKASQIGQGMGHGKPPSTIESMPFAGSSAGNPR